MAEGSAEITRGDTEPRKSLWHRHSDGNSGDDAYDHEIRLVDTTSRNSRNASSSPGPRAAVDVSTEPLDRTRSKLKASVKRRQDEWAYRRYQKDRIDEGQEADLGEPGQGAGQGASARRSKDTYGTSTIRRKYDEMKDRVPAWQQSKQREHARKLEEHEIDILHENQRGAFFCGIPLYSHNSLLNFDPPAWQTRDFKESPVNITNAQPPDPTWTWAWKTWYVDMSHDVDEEGWEYSLSFQQGLAWHGTHNWWHSWVRRRRWLRKRVKIDPNSQKHLKDAMHEAHKLNLDYFTIHSTTRESSTARDPATMADTNRYSATLAYRHESDDEEVEDDITNMPALMTALKKATVDRKKLNAVKSFIANGDQELHYLAENLPNIMDTFVYQTSRRHVLSELQHAAARARDISEEKAPTHSSTKGKGRENESSQDGISMNTDGIREALEDAIKVAQTMIRDSEYWSDVKATVQDAETLDVPPPPPGGPDLAPYAEKPYPPLDQSQEPKRTVIKGIPDEAGIGQGAGIARRVMMQMREEAKVDMRHRDKANPPETS